MDGQARGSETRGTPAFTENVGKLYSDVTEEIYAEYSKKLDDLKREYGMDSDKK